MTPPTAGFKRRLDSLPWVGEYQGLAGLRLGFAAVFTLRAPQAKDGPSDIFFARIGPGDGDDQDDRR
jgi:hypothetical protein